MNICIQDTIIVLFTVLQVNNRGEFDTVFGDKNLKNSINLVPNHQKIF